MEEPEFYLDKTWRVSRREHQFGGDPALTRSSSSFPQKRSNKHGPSGTCALSKSSSVRINHHASPPSGLRRSASTRNQYSESPEEQHHSTGGLRKITKKCSAMAKEQKARFYIMKRCVAMLVRWRKHRDS